MLQEGRGHANSCPGLTATVILKVDLFDPILRGMRIYSDVLRCKRVVESISQYPTEGSRFVPFSFVQIMHKILKAA
jgi:hypothetical protein